LSYLTEGVIPAYSYTAAGVFILGRIFREAWGEEAPKMQDKFNHYLTVLHAQCKFPHRTYMPFDFPIIMFLRFWSVHLLMLDLHIVLTQSQSLELRRILFFIYISPLLFYSV
jgi:hypothetical protein